MLPCSHDKTKGFGDGGSSMIRTCWRTMQNSLGHCFFSLTFIYIQFYILDFHIWIGLYSLCKLSFFPQFSLCKTEVHLPFIYSFIITHKTLYLAIARLVNYHIQFSSCETEPSLAAHFNRL